MSFKQLSPAYRHVFIDTESETSSRTNNEPCLERLPYFWHVVHICFLHAIFMFMTCRGVRDYSTDTIAGENIHYSKALEVDKWSDVWLTVHRNSVWIRKTN